MSSCKSNENIHKKESGSYYVFFFINTFLNKGNWSVKQFAFFFPVEKQSAWGTFFKRTFLFSARPRSVEYTIGICFEAAKNTKAFEWFFTGFQRSLWKFSTTGNLYSLKSWLWLGVVACVVRWPISNALDIWLVCFTRMCNWNYGHKHRGFMVNSILGHFDLSQLAAFHWSIRSLVNSYLYCTQVKSILSIFRIFFVY